jgi:FdhD protein
MADVPVPPTGAAQRTLADGRRDLLVREEPLLLVVHGQQLLTMRTPGRDEDLALGFLLSEGVVRAAADVVAMEFAAGDAEAARADELRVTLRTPPQGLLRDRLARTHEIRSSCGVCGVADVQAILAGAPPLLPGVPKLPRSRIAGWLRELTGRQELFALTGGCHGALVAHADGGVLGFAEDVGRHNALDKALGEAARGGADFARCVAVLSGRAGYDLVAKCLRLRLPVVVSVSAPSALAFDLCADAGATLVGFARGDDCEVYCGAERLVDG